MTNGDLVRKLGQLSVPAAEWVGIRELREVTTVQSARDGKPDQCARQVSHGAMVEVLAGGCIGYAATGRLDVAGLQEAATRALAQARAQESRRLFAFDQRVRPKAVGTYRSKALDEGGALDPAEVAALVLRLSARLRVSDEIIRTTAAVRVVEAESRLVSSSGSDVTQQIWAVSTDLSATGQRGSVVQKRTDDGPYAYSRQDRSPLDGDTLDERADRCSRECLELLAADDCPEATTTLLLEGDQMMLQIHESIGHPLELDRILGDERNYAGSSFVRLADFGQLVYGSPLLTVTFDPTMRAEFASFAFDDVGQQASREVLIDKGLLVRGIGGLESQARAGVPGVATQRTASWNRPPIDRIANINVEPGTMSRDELIAGVERGVLMMANRSWSIDDRRHKFQFGCEYGRLIEDGRLTRVVKNPNYRGTSLSFWRALSGVADRSTMVPYGTPYCGKGEPNQAIRVGHASPTCRFDGIEVFGGAS